MVKKYSRRYLLTHLRYIQFFSSSSDNRLKKPPRNSKFTKTKLIHRSSIVPRKEKKRKIEIKAYLFVEEAMRLISSVQPRRRRRGSCKWPAARVYGNIACTRHTEQVIPERERERERESVFLWPRLMRGIFPRAPVWIIPREFSAVFRILFDGQHRFPCARGSQRGRKRASGCLARVMYLPQRKGHLHTANSTREGSGG